MEHSITLMVVGTKATGIKTLSMVRELFIIKMEKLLILDNGRMENLTVKEVSTTIILISKIP